MRLLIICQNYWPEPFNVDDICEGLVSAGHSVTVLTGLPNYPDGVVPEKYRHGGNREQRRNGVRVLRVPIVARGADLRSLNKLRRVANYLSFALSGSLKAMRLDEEYDAVLVLQFSPILMSIPGLVVGRTQNVPVLLYIFDLWPEDMMTGGIVRGSLPYRAMKAISKAIYGKADKIAVTSPDFEKYLHEDLGLLGVRTIWLPQYAESQFEELSEASSADCRPGPLQFVFAGNVGVSQSVDVIVRAASLLVGRIDALVHIVGSGSQLNDCKALAERLKVGNVVFHGRRPLDEMREFYQRADAMLLTLAESDGGSKVPLYTIPRKLQSYLASGKPIIVSAPGAASRIVRDADCGLCCTPGSPEELAGAMIRFASLQPSEKQKMGRNARTHYAERFSRAQFFKQLNKELRVLKGTEHVA